jgi:hypothetical protein
MYSLCHWLQGVPADSASRGHFWSVQTKGWSSSVVHDFELHGPHHRLSGSCQAALWNRRDTLTWESLLASEILIAY